jgi:mannose-1-phosphate guanylyltransferase
LPEIHKLFIDNYKRINSQEEKEAIYEIYNQIKGISIDYGIMEKATNVYLIQSSFTWSDLGTWYSLYENKEQDANGNVVSGENFMVFDSKNSLFYSTEKDKIYVAKGIENVIMVDTKDAFLLVNIENEQSVKQIVDELRINDKEQYL